MKKLSLIAVTLLSVTLLNACTAASKKSNTKSSSSSSVASSSKKTASSSSSSTSSSSSDGKARLREQLKELEDDASSIKHLPNASAIPELASIQSLHPKDIFGYMLEQTEPKEEKPSTSYEDMVALFGEPIYASASPQESSADFIWQTENGRVAGVFKAQKLFTVTFIFSDSKTVNEPSTVSDGQSPKQVLDQLGHPNEITRTGSATIYGYTNSSGERFGVSFRGEKVDSFLSSASIKSSQELFNSSTDGAE